MDLSDNLRRGRGSIEIRRFVDLRGHAINVAGLRASDVCNTVQRRLSAQSLGIRLARNRLRFEVAGNPKQAKAEYSKLQ